jgi:hypothetical protein
MVLEEAFLSLLRYSVNNSIKLCTYVFISTILVTSFGTAGTPINNAATTAISMSTPHDPRNIKKYFIILYRNQKLY